MNEVAEMSVDSNNILMNFLNLLTLKIIFKVIILKNDFYKILLYV